MSDETDKDASYNPNTRLFAAMMAASDSYAVSAYSGDLCKDEEDMPASEKRQEFYC